MEAAISAVGHTWGAASIAAPGEVECGDRHFVADHAGGVFLAVVDALGHGHEAAVTAAAAVHALSQRDYELPIESIASQCHELLRSTRGVTIGMAAFDGSQSTLTWLGIGNVTGMVYRGGADAGPGLQPLPSHAGVLGDQVPKLHATQLSLQSGDCVVVATDGLRNDFDQVLPSSIEPQALARLLVRRFAKGSDDALVLVWKWNGSAR